MSEFMLLVCLLVILTAARPDELPAPFDGQRQYSHQVQTALTTTDGSGRVLTPGSGENAGLLDILLC